MMFKKYRIKKVLIAKDVVEYQLWAKNWGLGNSWFLFGRYSTEMRAIDRMKELVGYPRVLSDTEYNSKGVRDCSDWVL